MTFKHALRITVALAVGLSTGCEQAAPELVQPSPPQLTEVLDRSEDVDGELQVEDEMATNSAVLIDPLPEAPPLPDEIQEQDPGPAAPPAPTFSLRRGETLAHFARWSGVAVEEIAESSGLDLHGAYPVGTEVMVQLTDLEHRSTLESKREEHHRKRVEGYLASRGGSVGTEFHRVKTGDTAWTIAKRSDNLPVWVVESYNPTVDLDALRPGQELMLPILADTVVDADVPAP